MTSLFKISVSRLSPAFLHNLLTVELIALFPKHSNTALLLKMKFFQRKPSPDTALLLELQAALDSAAENNRSLQDKLQTEREQQALVEKALLEAVLRSQQLQDTLDVSSRALSVSRAEVTTQNAHNHGLHEEN